MHILRFALPPCSMAAWIPVYLTVPNWWTFRWFQFVFPINNAAMNIFVQLSLCTWAVSLWGIPRNLRAEQQEVLRRDWPKGAYRAPGPVGWMVIRVAANQILRVTDSSKLLLRECGLGPTALGPPEGLLEMQSFGPHPSPVASGLAFCWYSRFWEELP